MNRREAIKRAFGFPVVLAGVVQADSSGPVLELRGLRTDMHVFDHGQGKRFALTLMNKPWPKVGDRVRFTYNALHLLGTVSAFHTEAVNGSDRVFYYVQGTVQGFHAKDRDGN